MLVYILLKYTPCDDTTYAGETDVVNVYRDKDTAESALAELSKEVERLKLRHKNRDYTHDNGPRLVALADFDPYAGGRFYLESHELL